MARAPYETFNSLRASAATAAKLTGWNRETIGRAARAGAITARHAAYQGQPTLERVSVLLWSEAQRKVEADRAARRRRGGPPDDDHVWLDSVAAAAVLGITPHRVRQLIDADRVPATRHGRRWWLRRDYVEQRQAARAFQQRRATSETAQDYDSPASNSTHSDDLGTR